MVTLVLSNIFNSYHVFVSLRIKVQVWLLPLYKNMSYYLASQLHFSIQNSGELEQIFVQKVKLTSEIDQF